jgi:CheY-like chemotaxis protein
MEIMLVEDNPGDADLAMELLADSSMTLNVAHAIDGFAAMRRLRKKGDFAGAARPDLILLDLNLPGMHGHDVLKEIKTDATLKTIPVIILTMSDNEDDVRRAYENHANSYIVKSFDIGHFNTVIRTIEEFWFNTARLPREKTQ